MSIDLDEQMLDQRIAALLNENAPPKSDPVFRIKVLERRETQRFRRKSVSLAVSAAVLVASVAGSRGAGASFAETGAIVLLCAALGAWFVYAPVVARTLGRHLRSRGPVQNT